MKRLMLALGLAGILVLGVACTSDGGARRNGVHGELGDHSRRLTSNGRFPVVTARSAPGRHARSGYVCGHGKAVRGDGLHPNGQPPHQRVGQAGDRAAIEVLTTTGRTSGEPRQVPVSPIAMGGQEYLVSPYGNVGWVHNARANPTRC